MKMAKRMTVGATLVLGCAGVVAGFSSPGLTGTISTKIGPMTFLPYNAGVQPSLSLLSSRIRSEKRSCVASSAVPRFAQSKSDDTETNEATETIHDATPFFASDKSDAIATEECKSGDNMSSALVLETMDDEVQAFTQKAINGLFLAAAFGYALYTILNIDSEITRGWTQSEIAMRIPLDNWSNYENSLEAKPIFTKTLINVIIYLLGDWLSQTAFQGKNVLEFDVARTLRNGFIGLCFGPLVHMYYEFSDSILPVEGGIMNRVEKIFMDQTIYLTVKCSMYICAVGLLAGEDWSDVRQNVKDKIGGIVITAWKFWPLVHCITYGLIPARHRILWVNSVDLVWNAILATKASKDSTEDDTSTVVEEVSIKETKPELVIEAQGLITSSSSSEQLKTIEIINADDFNGMNRNQTESSLIAVQG